MRVMRAVPTPSKAQHNMSLLIAHRGKVRLLQRVQKSSMQEA